jgi:hypothetical protein
VQATAHYSMWHEQRLENAMSMRAYLWLNIWHKCERLLALGGTGPVGSGLLAATRTTRMMRDGRWGSLAGNPKPAATATSE